MKFCTVEVLHSSGDDECGQPYAQRIVTTCPCGHVETSLACPNHGRNLEHLWCANCYELDGHLCAVALLELTCWS